MFKRVSLSPIVCWPIARNHTSMSDSLAPLYARVIRAGDAPRDRRLRRRDPRLRLRERRGEERRDVCRGMAYSFWEEKKSRTRSCGGVHCDHVQEPRSGSLLHTCAASRKRARWTDGRALACGAAVDDTCPAPLCDGACTRSAVLRAVAASELRVSSRRRSHAEHVHARALSGGARDRLLRGGL